MASGDIRGNTGAIKSAAAQIRSDASSYGQAARMMFETVDALKNTFTSEDGTKYIAEINKHRETFDDLQKKLQASAEAFETAADDYIATIKANMG